MAVCAYCGEPAGFLRSTHKECRKKFQIGSQSLKQLIVRTAGDNNLLPRLNETIADLKSEHRIDDYNVRSLVIEGWESAVQNAFEDNVLTVEEEGRLLGILESLNLSQEEVDRGGAFSRVIKGAVLRDVLNGDIPQRIAVDGSLPFNLQRKEHLVWLIPDATYLEEKTRRRFVGGSHGASIKICKGVYYRVGAFKGRSVPYTETTSHSGCLGVTTKHLYFSGSDKSFRIQYGKIVSWEPYSNVIGLMRDAQNARRQSFVTGDGWFIYNLVVNLARIST